MDYSNETSPSEKQVSSGDAKSSNITTSICSNDSWMASGNIAVAPDGDRLCNDADLDNDNTVSEELSRFSSPSQSQSSSCTSITNPFYDGPVIVNECLAGNTGIINQSAVVKPKNEVNRGSRRVSSSSHRKKSAAASNAGPTHQTGVPSQSILAGNASINLTDDKVQQRVIIIWDLGYLLTCQGFLQFLQLVMTVAALVCLVSAGGKDGGLLNLPLSWHFRIMLFVLVLTLLVTVSLLFGNVTSLISIFGFEWTFFDMIVYSLFAFLYLVGSSLVASAFDFYEKMKTDVSKETISQLVTSVKKVNTHHQ
ncbi:hypothetical protein Btru_046073 [Bulinus truncatus]|nr:hypothetical protein Btru_046073 [Bulinus truncatus]